MLKVKNKGFVNYTFKVLVENAPSNEFYNLVVTEDDSKNVKKPYILKYVVDNDALPLFKANNQNFQYFKGNRYVVSFDSFFNSKKTNAKSTNVTCPESTGYINNIPGGFGGGSDGGINNVPSTNLVQPVFNYFPNNFTGYFELWMNSYDTSTNQSTSIGGTVHNSTGVYIPSYQPSPINPITGGSQISSLTITWSVGGTFTYKNCNTYLDGKQECSYTTINYYVPDRPVEEVNERLTNETNDCPKIVGEIAVITPETPDCDPELQNVYGECVEDDKIINNLTGKADCVYGKLESNSVLSKTLEKFVGVKTPVHLIINDKSNLREKDNDPNSQLVNGKTYYGTSFYITITLNTEQANNRPSLAVARTILHEAIHAEIYRKIKTTSGMYFDSSNNEWRLPDDSRAHFPTLFDNFNEDPNNPHHHYMANYYRTALEAGLKEYAALIGETHPDQFYKDFVWNGLLDTKAWKNQFADLVYAENEKNRIINVISNYEKSRNNECQ